MKRFFPLLLLSILFGSGLAWGQTNTPTRTPTPTPTPYWWQPRNMTPVVGAISSGTVPDVYTDNGTRLVLTEVVSENPAFDYHFVWTGAPTSTVNIVWNGYYDGNAAHETEVQAYNYNTSTWVDLNAGTKDIPSDTADSTLRWTLPSSNYLSGVEFLG